MFHLLCATVGLLHETNLLHDVLHHTFHLAFWGTEAETDEG